MRGWEVRTDFGDLVVDQAIVHEVPQRAKDEEPLPLKLSETVCRLDDDVRTALQSKLRDVLDRLGREVVEDPELKSPLPDAVRAFCGANRISCESPESWLIRCVTARPGRALRGFSWLPLLVWTVSLLF